MLRFARRAVRLLLPMKIAKNTVVAFDYVLKDKDGKILDSSEGREPLEYLHGAGNIIVGLEKEMEGLAAGDKKHVEVEPEDGYGAVDTGLIIEAARKNIEFAGTIEPGMRFHAQDGSGGMIAFTVVGVDGDKIKLDGNHPLAGVKLFFDVEIRSVREATEQEIYAKSPSRKSCSCGGGCSCGCDEDDDDDGCCGGECSCGCGHHR